VKSLLVVDIGNTTTRFGLWRGQFVGEVSVFPTSSAGEVGVVGAQLEAAMAAGGAALEEVEVGMCSAVHRAEEPWREWCAEHGRPLFVVRGDTPTPLVNRYRQPQRLGGDRLAAAVGAVKRAGAPVVVASLGTAAVVDAVSAEGEYLGGAIAAGLQTGLTALATATEGLPRVDAREAPSALGGDTEECLWAGAAHGMAALVEGLAERMREVVGAKAPLVLTGGDAELVSRHLRGDHKVISTLTLEGVAAVWEHNRGKDG